MDQTKCSASFTVGLLHCLDGFRLLDTTTPKSFSSVVSSKVWFPIVYLHFLLALPKCITWHLEVLKGICHFSDHSVRQFKSACNWSRSCSSLTNQCQLVTNLSWQAAIGETRLWTAFLLSTPPVCRYTANGSLLSDGRSGDGMLVTRYSKHSKAALTSFQRVLKQNFLHAALPVKVWPNQQHQSTEDTLNKRQKWWDKLNMNVNSKSPSPILNLTTASKSIDVKNVQVKI